MNRSTYHSIVAYQISTINTANELMLGVPYKALTFSGGEVHVNLKLVELPFPHNDARFVIDANLYSSEALIELLLLTDALRRMAPEAPIRLYCRYFPYARQDRANANGESLSLKVICDIINSQRYSAVVVWDSHSDVTLSLLNNVVHKHAADFVANIPNVKDYVFVSPDAGALKKVYFCAQRVGIDTPVLVASKHRDTATGKLSETRIEDFPQYSERPFLIIDDICDGGRTFNQLARVIQTKSKIELQIDLYVTHGIFSAGFAELIDNFRTIYVANYIPGKIPGNDYYFPPDNVIVV